MSTVTTDDDDANEADKEAELLVDPRDPRERKEPLDFELRSDALDEDDASDEFDGDERKGIEWMKQEWMDGSLRQKENVKSSAANSNPGMHASIAGNCGVRFLRMCYTCEDLGFSLLREVSGITLHVHAHSRTQLGRSRRPPRGTPICSRSL